MSETLELQQVICPSCKQVITSFSPFQAEVECPYCHNKAFNPLITAKKVPIPERLIIFRTSEKDFEKSMIDNLVFMVMRNGYRNYRSQSLVLRE